VKRAIHVLAILAFCLGPAWALADLNDGLIAFYPFNGNANDETLNGFDGVVYGASLSSDRFGDPDRAYFFDGADDYILVAHSETLNVATGEFSVCCWVRFSEIPGLNGRLVSKMGAGTTGPAHGDGDGYTLTIYGIEHYFDRGRAFINIQQAGVGDVAITAGPLLVDEWYFLAGVRDSSDVLRLYVNGCEADLSSSLRIGQCEADLVIGAKIAEGDEKYFRGWIDDVRIYNRALAPDELLQLLDYGHPSAVEITTWGRVKSMYR
jgi:hypothetical protein